MKRIVLQCIILIIFSWNAVHAQLDPVPIEENEVNYLLELHGVSSYGRNTGSTMVCMASNQVVPTGYLADLENMMYAPGTGGVGRTCCSSDEYTFYFCDSETREFYITDNSFTGDYVYFDVNNHGYCDEENESFTFHFPYGGSLFQYEFRSETIDGTTKKTVGAAKVHPLYLLNIRKRFNKQYDALPIRFSRKRTTYNSSVPPNAGEDLFNISNECMWATRYQFTLQVKVEGGSWHTLSTDFFDPTDGNYSIPYSTIASAFGAEQFVGKNCFIRLIQGMGRTFTTIPISFYYFPSLYIDYLNVTEAQCHNESSAGIEAGIGNLPSSYNDTLNFIYLLYRYTRNPYEQSNLPEINEEDRTECLYEGGYCTTVYFQYPEITEDKSSLSNIINVSNIPAGIYKFKAYILLDNDTLHYYPADTVFEINEPDPVSFTINYNCNFGSYQIPTGENSAPVTLETSGGWGNSYQYNVNNAGWSASYTDNVTFSLQEGKHQICVRDINSCYAQPECRNAELNAPTTITIAKTDSSQPTCNPLDNGYTTNGWVNIHIEDGVTPYIMEIARSGSGNMGSTISNLASSISALRTSYSSREHAISIIDYYDSHRIIGYENTIINLCNEGLNMCSDICGGDPSCMHDCSLGNITYFTHLEQIKSCMQELLAYVSVSSHDKIYTIDPGYYHINIIDYTFGDMYSYSDVLGEPEALEINSITIPDIDCWYDSYTATISGSSPAIQTYYARRETTSELMSNVTGVFPDLNPDEDYTFYYSNTNGCISPEQTESIPAAPSEIIITNDITESSCVRAGNGVAQISATGGTPNEGQYRIDMFNPALLDNNWYTSKTFSELNVANDYIIRVRDNYNCTTYDTFDIVSFSDTLRITNVSSTNALCDEIDEGTISINIDAGANPAGSYTYSLYYSDLTPVTSATTSSISHTFNNLSTGNYYIELSDPTTCSDNETGSVGVESGQLFIDHSSYTASNTACNGVSTGSLTALATGGFPGGTTQYHYTLDQTDGDELRSSTTPGEVTFDLLPEGIYNLIVGDDEGCYDTVSGVIIGHNEMPVHFQMLALQDQYCDAHTASFTIQASTESGDNIESIVLTYPNNTTESLSTSDIATKTGLLANTNPYIITAADNQGCENDTSIIINNLHNEPVISVNILDSAACSSATNGSVEVSATQTMSTGDMIFTFGADSDTDPAIVVFGDLSPDTYSISVTDTMGCESNTSITLPVITHPIQIVNYAPIDASCIRAANAGYHAEAFGGIYGDAGIYFELNNTDILYGGQADFEGYPVTGGNMIRVYDSYGCYDEIGPFWFSVREDSLNISLENTINITCPEETDGEIEVNTVNGNPFTQGFQYRVIDSETENPILTTYGTASDILDGIPVGSYYVEVTDEDNCLAYSQDITISQPDPPQLVLTPGYVAEKGSNTGWIDAQLAGGNGSYNVEWYTGDIIDAGSLIQSETTDAESSVNDLYSGTYTIRIQDIAQCIFWDDEWYEETVQVNEPENALELNMVEITPVSCNGLSDGQITLEGHGGWGNVYYYGTDPDDISLLSPVFADLPAGVGYLFYVKDSSGIIASIMADITEPEELTASVNTVHDALCYGSADGSVTLDITGGNETYFVSGDGVQWTEGSVLTDLMAGDYTLYVRDNMDCSTTAFAAINEPFDISLADTSITNTKCLKKEGIINVSLTGGTPAYQYEWYQGVQLLQEGNPSIDSLYSGVYNLHVIDANSCTKDFTLYISDLTDLEIASVYSEPVSCWGSNDGYAEVNVQRGTPPYLIIWPDSTNESTISNLEQGTHLISVYDAEGCKVFENFTIESPDSLWIEVLDIVHPLCLGVANGRIEVTAYGGTPGYDYHWNTGRNSNSVSGLDAGSYDVEVTDNNGCTNNAAIEIEYEEEPEASVTEDITICNNNVYPVDPGEYDYYEWSSESGYLSSDRILLVEEPGKYFVELEDNRGCQFSDTVNISVSETVLGAQMLMASIIHVNDTIVIFEASYPVPDSIDLYMDESLQVIEEGQYYNYVVANDTGIFDITLISHLNDCQDIITKTLCVLPDDGSNDDIYLTNHQIIKNIKLSPNPSSTGDFSLKIELFESSDVALRMVSFGDGNTVDMRQLYNNNNYYEMYNRNDLPPGIYLISVQAGDEMQNIKLIIL